jgi:hypothetical protein
MKCTCRYRVRCSAGHNRRSCRNVDPADQEPPCTMASLLGRIPIEGDAEQAEVIQKVLFVLRYGGLHKFRGGLGEVLDSRKTFLQTLDTFCLAVEQDLFVFTMTGLMLSEKGGKP